MCSDPELSNKKKFPTFARTYPMTKQLTSALIALLKNFSWHTVALLTSSEHKYEVTRRHVKENFSQKHITISYEAYVPSVIEYVDKTWDIKFPKLLRKIKERARSKW